MLIAMVATLFYKEVVDFKLIAGGLVIIGTVIGVVWAQRVQMTGMPELVALFNGFGGLASVLVGWAEFEFGKNTDLVTKIAIYLAIAHRRSHLHRQLHRLPQARRKNERASHLVCRSKGCQRPDSLPPSSLGVVYVIRARPGRSMPSSRFPSLLGVLGVLPIGGGDMPVIIAFLNSFSGLAGAAAGFVILNKVLIVAGCLVGTSGIILTIIMCKAMNRTFGNVLFGGFGAAGGATGKAVEGEMKGVSVEDAYYVLEAAQNVVFVPGYGMAVAQAQHAVKELGALLEKNGAEVRYAIHPVAGRMPGHMNVLLAEADVPYEQLCEMDAVNATIGQVDVAIVIGANDVVNPAAGDDPSSPIYGMPIINVHEARTVFALKRGKGAGFLRPRERALLSGRTAA
jgi:NAD(P) transhydrogenase subunit beta